MADVIGGHGYPYAATHRAPAESIGTSAASAVTFLAGVWLIIAPLVLGYAATEGGFDGYWNDVTVGIVIALLTLVRAVGPREVPWFSMVSIVLGVWLIIAPWVLVYHQEAAATVNDMIVGAIVLTAASGARMTLRRRARLQNEARHAETEQR